MWQNTSEGDGSTDEGIEFFVAANRELEMAGGDTLDFEIFGGILELQISIETDKTDI